MQLAKHVGRLGVQVVTDVIDEHKVGKILPVPYAEAVAISFEVLPVEALVALLNEAWIVGSASCYLVLILDVP